MGQSERPVKTRGRYRPLTQDGRRLRRRRIAAGLTLRALADKAGVGIGTLSDLENDRQCARVTTLAAVAAALGCEITDLMPPLCAVPHKRPSPPRRRLSRAGDVD